MIFLDPPQMQVPGCFFALLKRHSTGRFSLAEILSASLNDIDSIPSQSLLQNLFIFAALYQSFGALKRQAIRSFLHGELGRLVC